MLTPELERIKSLEFAFSVFLETVLQKGPKSLRLRAISAAREAKLITEEKALQLYEICAYDGDPHIFQVVNEEGEE